MLSISSSIRSAKTPDGAVLLDIHHNRMLTMNALGIAIFELIAKGRGETEIVEEISRICGASREIVAADVKEFLEALKDSGVLSDK
jgi:hypothetical protein